MNEVTQRNLGRTDVGLRVNIFISLVTVVTHLFCRHNDVVQVPPG